MGKVWLQLLAKHTDVTPKALYGQESGRVEILALSHVT